jgi:hypothetical protein
MHRNPHSQIVTTGAAHGVGLSLRSGLMYEDYPPMGYNTFRK